MSDAFNDPAELAQHAATMRDQAREELAAARQAKIDIQAKIKKLIADERRWSLMARAADAMRENENENDEPVLGVVTPAAEPELERPRSVIAAPTDDVSAPVSSSSFAPDSIE